jgi:hypothetical protein
MAQPAAEPAAGVAAPAARTVNRVTIVALLCLLPAGYWYATLLFVHRPGLFPPSTHGLVFNSMLLHLLAGRFDIDPQVIGDDGFLRNGAVYPYFGILPALLRLPLLLLPRFGATDLTALSCLAAVTLMALFKQLSLLAVWRAGGACRGAGLLALMTVGMLLGGAQIQFLKPSVYQEVCLWADVFAAAFIWLVLRSYLSPSGFTAGALAWLALTAGLCLQTRVSTALGLYIVTALLLLHAGYAKCRTVGVRRLRFGDFAPLLLPILILLAFIATAGLVNAARWGNPLVFEDPRLHIRTLAVEPERLVRYLTYGNFSLVRLGYGLMYYFFPVWVLHDSAGHLLWDAWQRRVIDTIELPPSTFLLSDPLLLGLAGYAVVHVTKWKNVARPAVILCVSSGLAVPPFLMMTAIYMAFRYRIEFYPLFEFLAFIGFGRLSARRQPAAVYAAVTAAVVIGVVAATVLYVLYQFSRFGHAEYYLEHMSVIAYYRALMHL